MKSLWVVCVCALCGCVNVEKLLEIQARQQNAVITSMVERVNWNSISAVLQSRLNNPRITVGAYYVQGAMIDVTTNGIESSVAINSTGTGDGTVSAETKAEIAKILSSPLPTDEKEKAIVDALVKALGGGK